MSSLKKKDMNFQSVDSMQSVVKVVNEAAAALNDKTAPLKRVLFQKFLLVHWERVLVVQVLLPPFMVLAL